MEQGPLKNGQLDYLARHDAVLGPGFARRVCQECLTQQAHHHSAGRVPCQLGSHRSPGPPWLALWTHGQHCDLLNSDGPPSLKPYEVPLLQQRLQEPRTQT